MNRVIDTGQRGDYQPMDFHHNIKIDNIFQKARRKAWASIKQDQRIQQLIEEGRRRKSQRYQKKRETQKLVPVLNMYK